MLHSLRRVVFALVWLGVVALGAVAPADAQTRYTPDEITVYTSVAGDRAAVNASVADLGTVTAHLPQLGAVRVKLRRNLPAVVAAAALSRRATVTAVEPVVWLRATATPNDPFYNQQYGLRAIAADHGWDLWTPRAVVRVAVIDTGIYHQHPDLNEVLARDSSGRVLGYNSLQPTSPAEDDNGHGTHVAGIIAARTNNGVGVAGTAGWNPLNPEARNFVQLLPVKVLDEEGLGRDSDVAAGIIWAADQGSRILNLSLGSNRPSTLLTRAVEYAQARGCLVVAAAGNDGMDGAAYPARLPGVLSVAATDSDDRLAYFSHYGATVNIAAPGVSILSTTAPVTSAHEEYEVLSGTSMATPFVSGAAAVVLAQYPSLTAAGLATCLRENTDPYVPYFDPQQGMGPGAFRYLAEGAGRVNVLAALQAAEKFAAVPQSLRVSASPATGGETVTATVTLDVPAPQGGRVISLQDNSAAVSVPSSVTVPAGSSSATFPVQTVPVMRRETAVLSARALDRQAAAVLTIVPAELSELRTNPISVSGGETAIGTVVLTGPAPASGIKVRLQSGHIAVRIPASIVVPPGANMATFPIQTKVARVERNVTLRARYGALRRTANLQVRVPPADLVGLTLSAESARPEQRVIGTVQLNFPAPAGGVEIQLHSSQP